jgi:hypothetical protein
VNSVSAKTRMLMMSGLACSLMWDAKTDTMNADVETPSGERACRYFKSPGRARRYCLQVVRSLPPESRGTCDTRVSSGDPSLLPRFRAIGGA